MPPIRNTIRSTNAQIRFLIDYMSANPYLAREDFPSTPYHIKKHEEKWAKLKNSLKEYGPDKTVQKWKTTWRDLKRKAKIEQMKVEQAARRGEVSMLSIQAQSVLEILKLDTDNNIISDDDPDPGPLDTTIDETWNKKRLWMKKDGRDDEGDTNATACVNERLRIEVIPLANEDVKEEEDTSDTIDPFSNHRESVSSNNSQSKTKIKNNCSPREDSSILNTLNKFIDHMNEKERLSHQREMSRIEQNEKMMNLLGRMVNVIEDLAPYIKRLSPDVKTTKT